MNELNYSVGRVKAAIGLGIIALILTACDGGVPDIQNSPLIQPDYEYEIDTWGANSEIYEFTPKSNKNMSCLFLMLDKKNAMGLQCFPKEPVSDKQGQED